MRRAFTLIELVVVIAVIALLVGVLLPALARAREAGRSTSCLSNLRQMYMVLRAYADENRGKTPALGVPYTALPNWGLVVQSNAGLPGSTAGELFSANSVLVCPSGRARFGAAMQRTYAINVTGHSGEPGDPDSYDAGDGASIRLDRVERPSDTPLLMDAAPAYVPPPSPPPARSASVIDFRIPSHRDERLSRVHAGAIGFNAGLCDGSARPFRDIPGFWLTPLP